MGYSKIYNHSFCSSALGDSFQSNKTEATAYSWELLLVLITKYF